jgi:hypothetical protein
MKEKHKYSRLKNTELSYIAGFLDGDGCILAQLVKGNYKYKYTIRIKINFYQHKKRHWFLLKLKKLLIYGSIRIKKDSMAEYSISGDSNIENLLILLLPYLQIKKLAAKLVLKIITKKRDVTLEADFIEVCKMVDEIAELTDSKKRSVTSLVVKAALIPPVETEVD